MEPCSEKLVSFEARLSALVDEARMLPDADELTACSWLPSLLGAARAEDDDETARVAIKREELAEIFIMQICGGGNVCEMVASIADFMGLLETLSRSATSRGSEQK
jgi:hypothetical protein